MRIRKATGDRGGWRWTLCGDQPCPFPVKVLPARKNGKYGGAEPYRHKVEKVGDGWHILPA